MKPEIHGKQIDVGDALRTHVEGKIAEINSKYFNHGTNCKVTFAREGHGHGLIRVTISYLVGKNIMVNTEYEAADAYAAFDLAADKAAKRLRRYKKRLRDHHERTEKTPEAEIIKARDYTLALGETQEQEAGESEDGEPLVIAEMTVNIQTMSVSEAVMRLDLGGQGVFLFRNAKHNGLNVVYRRPDGNIGWIDPEQTAKTVKAKKEKAA